MPDLMPMKNSCAPAPAPDALENTQPEAASPGRGRTWLQWLQRHRVWLLVAVTILFVTVIRVRLRDMPLERDEGEYAYAGQLILHGIAPYKAAHTMKLPGTFAAYAVILAILGQSPAAIHLALAAVNAASIVLIFLIGRKLLDEAAGVTAAAAFGLFSLSPGVLGLAAHATHFVVLPALGGFLLLLGGMPKTARPGQKQDILREAQNPKSQVQPRALSCVLHSRFSIFGAGLLFGIAFVMKQHGIFFGLFGLSYLVWTRISHRFEAEDPTAAPAGPKRAGRGAVTEWNKDWRGTPAPSAPATQSREAVLPAARPSPRGLTPRPSSPGDMPSPPTGAAPSTLRLLKEIGVYGAGLALPYFLVCLWLWSAGAFHDFVFWTISYATKYASAEKLVNGPEVLRAALRAVVGPNLVLWILPWAGALLMWWEKRLDLNHRFFFGALTLCSLASVSMGFYFRGHYFILLLPALALLTGVAVSRALHLLKHDTTIELFLAIPVLGLFAIGVGAAIIGHGAIWFAMSPAEAMRETYAATLFSEAVRAADYLKAHTSKDTPVVVLGSEPEIYFYARRRSASRYIYTYPLMEEHAYAGKMQQEMIAEIESARPEYVVYVDDEFSWLERPQSDRKIYEWWQAYWTSTLDVVMTFDFEEYVERGVDALNPPKNPGPPTRKHLLIFKRRA